MFNRVLILALVVLSSAAGGFVAQQAPNAFAQPGVVVGHIDAESITLRNQARTRSINLQVTNDHAFIFINGIDGRAISIGDTRDYACVGIYNSKLAQARGGFSVAMAGDRDGSFIQFLDATKTLTRITKGDN